MNIPEEIVERVARVVNKEGWTCSDDHWQPDWYDECDRCQRAARDLARAALSAAAPHLMAMALRQGARDLNWLMAQGNLVEPDTASAGIRACMTALNNRADELEQK